MDKMHPSKAVLDYMTEMNRLFPRNELNDVFQSPTQTSSSLFNQLTPVKSSSSAESTPPEIFPEFTSNFLLPRDFETPFTTRRQRPIMGRRLMSDTPTLDQKPKQKTVEYDITNIWQLEDSQPPQNYISTEQRSQRMFYELFPTENKGFEFVTPVKNNSDWNISPTQLAASPVSNVSSNSNVGLSRPYPPSPRSIGSPVYGPSSSKYPDRPKVCTFCRKNGETPLVYTTHTVKQVVGDKHIVTCPILRSHVCSTCGASGDDAHTITYCPVLRTSNNGLPLQSTTITLKNTRVKSNGKRRY